MNVYGISMTLPKDAFLSANAEVIAVEFDQITVRSWAALELSRAYDL
jgi:hypothetical protein